MTLIIWSKQHWKIPKERDNREKKNRKYHLCKEIKTSIIEWLSDTIMLFLDQWMMSLQTVLAKSFLKISS